MRRGQKRKRRRRKEEDLLLQVPHGQREEEKTLLLRHTHLLAAFTLPVEAPFPSPTLKEDITPLLT